ncbi:hypothetical protein QTP88_005168 [Uroleucon formosanum]
MYDKRRKMYPVFPTSFNKPMSQLVENDFCCFNGDQFVFVPENDEFVCITTKENLKFMTTQNEFFGDGQRLKLFFGLPFLPSDEIKEAFLTLIAECPSLEEGHIFTDYLLSTYIDEFDALFPTYLWAQEPSG